MQLLPPQPASCASQTLRFPGGLPLQPPAGGLLLPQPPGEAVLQLQPHGGRALLEQHASVPANHMHQLTSPERQ